MDLIKPFFDIFRTQIDTFRLAQNWVFHYFPFLTQLSNLLIVIDIHQTLTSGVNPEVATNLPQGEILAV